MSVACAQNLSKFPKQEDGIIVFLLIKLKLLHLTVISCFLIKYLRDYVHGDVSWSNCLQITDAT